MIKINILLSIIATLISNLSFGQANIIDSIVHQTYQRKFTVHTPTGFTNNPKYFGKKTSESSSTSGEKKSSSFDGKKKSKSRSDRPKSFTFKKHSQKRAKV